ncbi:MAG: sulfotransferase family protein [Candidatus Eutrophobiaceae bacterium]
MRCLFIIGAQRSGTTFLHAQLDRHPQIRMAHPVRPEPKIFLDAVLASKGKSHCERALFGEDPHSEGMLYWGEKSASYMESLDVAQRISGIYPHARILAILREPSARAYSNYRFSVENGLETNSFKDALAMEPQRLKSARFTTSVSPFAYRARGCYVEQLKRWFKEFPENQVRILIFEEIIGNPRHIKLLYQWLGVDDSLVPESPCRKVNPCAVVADPQDEETLVALAHEYRGVVQGLESLLGRAVPAWHAAAFSRI